MEVLETGDGVTVDPSFSVAATVEVCVTSAAVTVVVAATLLVIVLVV